MSSAAQASPEHLAPVTSSLKRWINIAQACNALIDDPGPAQLAMFLRQVSFGGPTAASSVFHALLWRNKHLGARFPLHHFLVQPCRCHHLGHKSRQAPELQPWELLNLLAVTRELTGTVQVAGLFVISSSVACIRFEHFQRSHACVQGKRRVQPRLWP
ncbi:unnamed protein product [Effrenium voratum]|nr:unnamed protein product [Effrenium voratum]